MRADAPAQDLVLIQPRDPVPHDRLEPSHCFHDDPRREPLLLEHQSVEVEDHRPTAVGTRQIMYLRPLDDKPKNP
jgi:hypothetical protein